MLPVFFSFYVPAFWGDLVLFVEAHAAAGCAPSRHDSLVLKPCWLLTSSYVPKYVAMNQLLPHASLTPAARSP